MRIALAKILTPFRIGAGGPIGSGQQYWSWISLDDAAGVVYHALMTDGLHGPVNVVSPDAVTNAAFAETLARVLSRPCMLRVPAFAARILGPLSGNLHKCWNVFWLKRELGNVVRITLVPTPRVTRVALSREPLDD